MKLAAAAILIALTATPASGRHPSEWVPDAAGQAVYSLTNNRVGWLESYIDVRGTPGVIIVSDDTRGQRKILAPAQDLGRRDAGGLLLVLSDSSVANLPPYQPRYLPFW